MKKAIVILSVIAAILLAVVVVLLLTEPQTTPTPGTTPVRPTAAPTQSTQGEPVQTTPPTTTAPPETVPPFEPQKAASSDPANFGFKWEIAANGEIVESYTRENPISFEDDDYFMFPGIATFRGTNYRADASYGTANVVNEDIKKIWSMNVGYLSSAEWIGCGWTGQPLVVQWDEQTRSIMNLHEDKKNKEGLTEVIYAKMDGRVHFFDIEDGSETRKPLKLGMVFKGSGALDPRGYPLLYVGSGLNQGNKGQRFFIVSLIDGSVLYEFKGEDAFRLRKFCAFDSSPLVDAQTDTLIWPGESGVLYTFKLNTVYDKSAGTISVSPEEPVKTRYSNDYSKAGRYIGVEASATAVDHYLFMGDNSGMLQCVDVNTMELVWAHDLIDDINATAAFEWEDKNQGYLYVGPSKDYSGKGNKNDLPVRKINAATGETVWEVLINCGTYDGCAGGTMGSPMLGRKGSNIEDLVIFTMARTPGAWDSVVYALDKHTGAIVWQYETKDYTWSSPVGLYTPEGKGYVVQIDNEGRVYLIDAATGQVKDTFELGAHIEASPVVFNDRVVIGTRESVVILQID